MLEMEICLDLEAANFPKPGNWKERTIYKCDTGDLYVPTLEELIEACGEKFGVLERFRGGTFGAYVPNDISVNGLGATPAEAIARLWLAIQGME